MNHAKELITSITVNEREEEGGNAAVTYFPDGLVKIQGHSTGRGYQPPAKNGWYEVGDTSLLQVFFDRAKEAVRKNPRGETLDHGLFVGYRYSTTIVIDGRSVNFKNDIIGQTSHGIPIYSKAKHEGGNVPTETKIKKFLGGLDWIHPTNVPKVNNAL